MAGKRKSSDQRELEGNRSKRKIPEEIEIDDACIKPPWGISKGAKNYWEKYAPLLIKVGKLTMLNEQSFKQLCVLWAKVDTINKMLDFEFPSLLQESNNYGEIELKENEYSKMLRHYMASARQYEKDFGLTPDKAAGVYKPKKKEKDGFFED